MISPHTAPTDKADRAAWPPRPCDRLLKRDAAKLRPSIDSGVLFAFTLFSAAALAPVLVASGVHRVVGGLPQIRSISAHPTHRPSGPR